LKATVNVLWESKAIRFDSTTLRQNKNVVNLKPCWPDLKTDRRRRGREHGKAENQAVKRKSKSWTGGYWRTSKRGRFAYQKFFFWKNRMVTL